MGIADLHFLPFMCPHFGTHVRCGAWETQAAATPYCDTKYYLYCGSAPRRYRAPAAMLRWQLQPLTRRDEDEPAGPARPLEMANVDTRGRGGLV